ncbi:hypothetical protein [Halovivax gelatinilyticus]|uniref:hypothetical protein n=1 Tax=Halovivax gelatinilyticus TaxID=2961597 RepID=UPI0020CA5CC6|nr:hypothetical protein [Halovivax gelatinilyticus]
MNTRSKTDRTVSRRRVLALAATGTAALAGCLSSDDDGDGSNGGGFGVCSTPDTDDLEAMLPDESDVSGLSEAGHGDMSMGGLESTSRTFREGGSTDVTTVASRFGEPPQSEEDLSTVFDRADSHHAAVLAYVTAEEYAFVAGGFDEDHAVEMLRAFPVVDCADQASFFESEMGE